MKKDRRTVSGSSTNPSRTNNDRYSLGPIFGMPMSVAYGRGNHLEMLKELHFPHSLGLLYSAFTYYTGFKVNSGEYKLMGLAPYGEPKFPNLILDKLIDLKPDGTFWLDQSYFDYCTGLRMTNDKFDALFNGPARKPQELLSQRHMDLAASIQAVTEEIMLRLTRSVATEIGAENLCLAGGSLSTVLPMARCCATASSSESGFNRRLAMQAVRWGLRLPPTPCTRASPAASTTSPTP